MPERTNESRFTADIPLEKFKADFMEHGPVPSLARYYGVNPAQIFTLAIKYNLSLRKLNSERVRYQVKNAYDTMAKKLGHYPATHEMLQNKESIKLYGAIRRLFGSWKEFREICGYPSPPDTSIERAKSLYNDYLALGTLAKVAKKHNITTSTAGGILRKAAAKGLIKYPPEKPDPLPTITAEKLKADYMLYSSIGNIAKHYGVSYGRIANLVKKYKLPIKKLTTELAKKKLPDAYMKITKELGHHPSATELQRIARGLYNRIVYHYRSIGTFRKRHGYPMHRKGNPKLGSHMKELSEASRKTILKCIKTKPGMKSSEICNVSGLAYSTLRRHLSELIKESTVYRVKKGLFRYYFLKR